MEILMMANDEGKPMFRDFLCMSGAECPAAAVGFRDDVRASKSSALAGASSERQAGNSFEEIQFHGQRRDLSRPEMSNRFSGRKRSSLYSVFMGSTIDRMHHIGPDSKESSPLVKMLQNEVGGERPRRYHNDEMFLAIQPPRLSSTYPLILQKPIGSRTELVVYSLERSIAMKAGPMVHHSSRLGQSSLYIDRLSSNRYRDVSDGTLHISQPADDEGSRTCIKGSGIANVINTNSAVAERNIIGMLLGSSRSKVGVQNAETESANTPRRRSSTSNSRQMTIFYAGQAHVFDEVH